MRKLHNKAMLMLAVAAIAVLSPSCDKYGGDDDLYYVTSNSVADFYFMPKSLNITSIQNYGQNKIYGDWFANENVGKVVDLVLRLDYEQEHAEHYYFLDDSQVKKYIDVKNATGRDVLIDPNDIISPFKEYAEYFGDTLLSYRHDDGKYIGENNYCVLAVTGVDVTCDKDFDSQHPAGSNLNDIMCWGSYKDIYSYLHRTDENGNIIGKNESLPTMAQLNIYDIPLASIPENPLMMTENDFSLYFNSQPAEPGTYEFTVKFTFGPDPLSGEIVDVPSAKVSMVF